MLTRGEAAEEKRSEKVVGARGSVVLHTSKAPVRAAAVCRRARGVAFAVNSRQKREFVSLGLIPLNSNERLRQKWSALKAKVENYPINGPAELCTAEAMAPYCAAALEHRDAILAMGGSDEYTSDCEYTSDAAETSEDVDEFVNGGEAAEARTPKRVRIAREWYGF